MTRRLLEYGDDLNDVLRSALDAEKSAPASPDAARLAKIGAGIADRIGAPPPQPPTNPPPGHAAPVAVASKAPFVLLAAAVVAGLVAIGSMSNEKPAPAPAPRAHTAETTAPTIAEPAPSPPGISLNDLPNAPQPAAKAPTKPAPAPFGPTQEEIALIGNAHDALRTDPAAALALCKQHETKFAGGHFAQEREAVAIEALVYLNRKEEAKRRFASFDNEYPSSSHRVHLESLLAR